MGFAGVGSTGRRLRFHASRCELSDGRSIGWRGGSFHGFGAKMYSRGGGYAGQWVEGKREGPGSQLFAGKFGYYRWEGPFVEDKPHGKGLMHFMDGTTGDFEYVHGKPNADGGADKHDGARKSKER